MSNPLEIITELPDGFLEEFEAEFQASIPAEKVRATLNEAFIGRALIAEGGRAIEGIGQRQGEVDVRTFFRWQQSNPGCWQDPTFRAEFFADNKQLCDPGYRPKTNAARKGMTFVDGRPVR